MLVLFINSWKMLFLLFHCLTCFYMVFYLYLVHFKSNVFHNVFTSFCLFHVHKHRVSYTPNVTECRSVTSVRCVSYTHRYLWKQCVAVSTQRLLRIVPPQWCLDWIWMLTCQGQAPSGASRPPTIRNAPGGETRSRCPQPHKHNQIKFPFFLI